MIWLSGGELKTECSRIVATLFRSKSWRLYHASRKTPRACPENSTTDRNYLLLLVCTVYKQQTYLKEYFLASQVSDRVRRKICNKKRWDDKGKGRRGQWRRLHSSLPTKNKNFFASDVRHTFHVLTYQNFFFSCQELTCQKKFIKGYL